MGAWSASRNCRFSPPPPPEWAPGIQWMSQDGPNRQPEGVAKSRNLKYTPGNEAPARNLVAISKGITRLFIDAVVRNYSHTKQWCSPLTLRKSGILPSRGKTEFMVRVSSFSRLLLWTTIRPVHSISHTIYLLFRSRAAARSQMSRLSTESIIMLRRSANW